MVIQEEKSGLKIDKRKNNPTKNNLIRKDIELACEIGPLADPVCCPGCEDHDAATICSNSCEFAPLRLSSDPTFPVEKLITLLVFELKKLGIFFPCWSCEGHNNKDGDLAKNPSIWFYSDSVVHVRALENSISKIYGHL
jgi:hypothetical protein